MDEGSSKHLLNAKNTSKQIRTMMNLHIDISDNDDRRESFDSYNSAKKYTEYSEQAHIGKNRKGHHSPLGVSVDKQAHYKPKNNSSHIKYVDKKHAKKLSGNVKDQSITNNEADSQKQTIKVCHDRLSRYQSIVQLTQEQNQNLKQQNQYLLKKLRGMQQREEKIKNLYTKAKNYKFRWVEIKNEINIIKQQTYIYRSLLQELKQIALVDIPVLKQKVRQTEQADYKQQTPRRSFSKQRVDHPFSVIPTTNSKKNFGRFSNNEYECIYEQSEETEQKTFIESLRKLSQNEEGGEYE